MTVRHEMDDWDPVWSGDLLISYRCRRCAVEIAAVVVLVGEAEAEHWRAMLPGRLVLGVFSKDLVEMGDGRQYARTTAAPACTAPRPELEAS